MTRPPRSLNPRERRIVALVGEGLSPEDIAEELYVSRSTVRKKLARIARLLAGDRRVHWNELPGLLEEADRAA